WRLAWIQEICRSGIRFGRIGDRSASGGLALGRRITIAILILLAAVVLAFALGPRVQVDTRITFDPSAIGDDPEAYLERTEGKLAGIRNGLEKEIVWANPMIHAK